MRHGRENCLTWAQKKQDAEGGYLVIRWCRSNRVKWIKWPHFLWLPDKYNDKLQHLVPNKDEHTQKVLPQPWFKGHVKQGDADEEN